MENIVSRIPPNDIQAEQAVLGSMLVDKDAVLTVVEILKPDDFYRNENTEIYEAILDLYEQGTAIDLLTVKEQLRVRGKYDTINGFEYLANLTNPMYSISNVEYYARIVEEKSILRKLIRAANDISSISYEASEDINAIMDQAEKKIFDIAQKKSTKSYAAIKDVLVDTFALMEELYNRKEGVIGVPSGFVDLDNKTLGFSPRKFSNCGSQTCHGKICICFKHCNVCGIKSEYTSGIF